MKKLRKVLIAIFIIMMKFTILSVIFSCKQPAGNTKENGNETQQITVTVKKDEHIKKAPTNLKLKKSSKHGFTDLKGKMQKDLEFEDGFELGQIFIEKATGKEIKDNDKHTFNADTIIFLKSKQLETPKLAKITIGNISKEGDEITSEMEFTVSEAETEVAVTAKANIDGAKITFTPTLKNGKLQLLDKKTSLKITVERNIKKSEYSVMVKKVASPNTLIDEIIISGGKKGGIASAANKADIKKILSGGKDVIIELLGTEAAIIAGTETKTWTSFKINGKDFEFKPAAGLASFCSATIKLPAKGSIKDIQIEAASAESLVQINFKIKRLTGTADVPVETLLVNQQYASAALASLANGSKPEFKGAEPTHVEVQCRRDVIKSVTIDGSVREIKTKTGEYLSDIWYAEHNVTNVLPNGKEVSIVIEPKDKDNYHTITWVFYLKYKSPKSIETDYEFNGKNKKTLDKEFTEGLKNKTNPSLEVKGAFLNIRLKCSEKVEDIKINDKTISGNQLKIEDGKNVLLYSIPLNTTEQQVEITVNPSNLSLFSPEILKFKVKSSDGLKETIKPKFIEISGDTNLPQAGFKDKLSGGKPLYKTFSDSADFLITINNYEYDFLCETVKINGTTAETKKEKDFTQIRGSIPVTSANPVDVKIEFIAKTDIADDLIWEFQVQKGEKKPSFPKDKITTFKINGIGEYKNPLPKKLTDHLIDGTNPLYVFDGKKACIEIGCLQKPDIEKVIFKMDGIQKSTVIPEEKYLGYYTYEYIAKYEFPFTDANEHSIELIIQPKDSSYSELIYTFKLKPSGKKLPLPVHFYIDKFEYANGTKKTIKAEKTILSVKAEEDFMAEVKIGEKDRDEQICNIEENTVSGKTIRQALREINLLDTDGNASEKSFVIKVKPKNTEEYEETVCEYILTGTKTPINNVEGSIKWEVVQWDNGLENGKLFDYGAQAAILTANTKNPRASVEFQIFDIYGNFIAGQTAKKIKNTNGLHTSEKIMLFTDKPTMIKAWIIAEDGTKGTAKEQIFNKIALKWGYEDSNEAKIYKTKAYDTIVIEQSKLTSGNKIYLVFSAWNEAYGYSVDNEQLPDYQTKFVNIGNDGSSKFFYKTSIDVNNLLNKSKEELEAVLKIKKNATDCFTYKVKIKLHH